MAVFIRCKLSKDVLSSRVAEVAREHGWHPPKSLDSDENFKPEHTLFCRELRFVAIYALFGDLWAKKCLFGSKTVFLGQEVHFKMVYIAYYTYHERLPTSATLICGLVVKSCSQLFTGVSENEFWDSGITEATKKTSCQNIHIRVQN